MQALKSLPNRAINGRSRLCSPSNLHPHNVERMHLTCKAAKAEYGLFVCSTSPAIAEAMCHTGIDWMCLDGQHSSMSYESLAQLLMATSSGKAKRIVRVGGPTDRFGIQQALDSGADGVMIPLVNIREEAELAVSYCRFPPEGIRSVGYPVRGVYKKGVGVAALATYLKEANQEVEVWLQVESKECFESMDDILSVPGIHSAFLGPADMSFSYGLHVDKNYDLPATLASPALDTIYAAVLEASRKHKVKPGVFCLGEARARQLAEQGYEYVAYDVDLNIIINYSQSTLASLRK